MLWVVNYNFLKLDVMGS